jgi:hypothetical protein
VEVSGPVVEGLVEDNPYYSVATIPGGMYRNNPQDTQTFGVRATFVSSTAVDDKVVYHLVRAVFENFEQFRSLHPAFQVLRKEEMVRASLSAPIHPGALEYYEEAGLR